MKRIPKATYQSPEEVEHIIKLREADAALLAPGPSRQSVLKEIARLRAYAHMKRWIDSPTPAARQGRNQ